MARPRLTFFCELPPDDLKALFADENLVTDLVDLEAGVSLGILDLGRERAEVVRRLNEAGIPVTAWQLLPKEQGYWFNAGNAAEAARRYGEFKTWAGEHDLRFVALGLDLETDIRNAEALTLGGWSALSNLLSRSFHFERARRAHYDYALLVAQMHGDGYSVESYVFPPILDERRVGSNLLRRLGGLVDVTTDREVPMLYSSFFRPRGAGLLWSYASEAHAVAVGSTGGGVAVAGADQVQPLDWNELSRDLRLAHRWVGDVYVFSLEGCARQGFLGRLKKFDWDRPFTPPVSAAAQIGQLRCALRTALWISAHPLTTVLAAVVVLRLLSRLRRYLR
jgi:hypothetical protein